MIKYKKKPLNKLESIDANFMFTVNHTVSKPHDHTMCEKKKGSTTSKTGLLSDTQTYLYWYELDNLNF